MPRHRHPLPGYPDVNASYGTPCVGSTRPPSCAFPPTPEATPRTPRPSPMTGRANKWPRQPTTTTPNTPTATGHISPREATIRPPPPISHPSACVDQEGERREWEGERKKHT